MAGPEEVALAVKAWKLVVALTGVILIISVAMLAASLGRSSLAQGATALSIDVLPAGNTPTSVADIDTCAAAEEGDTFNVDIVIEDVTDLLAWEMRISYDPKVLEVRGADVEMFQAANEGSQILNLSEATPDDDGLFALQAVDTADPIAPDSGTGVLARLTLMAKGPGTSMLTIDKIDVDGDGTLDQGPFLRDVSGDVIGDEDGDTLFDGPANSAEIRVGQPCQGEGARVEAQPKDDGDGVDVWVVVGGTLAGVAALALAAALAVFLRRRSAGP